MLRYLLVCFLGLLTATPAVGQETGLAGAPRLSGRFSLSEAVELALENHLSVSIGRAELRAQQARADEAGAAFGPDIALGTYLSTGDRAMIVSGAPGVEPGFWTGLPPGGLSMNLSMMLPLYTGGRLRARLGQAAAGQRAALARTALILRQTAREVRRAYHGLLRNYTREETARSELAFQQELLRLSRLKLQVGKVAPYVVRRMEAEGAAAEQRLNSTRSEVELSMVALRTAMGVSVDSQIEVDFPEAEPGPDQSLEESVQVALSERPDLAIARYAVDSADARVAEALSDYSPQLAAYAMAEGMRSRLTGPAALEGGYQVGLVLSWSLFDGGERDARLREAEAMLEVERLALRKMEYDVAAEVAAARIQLQVARRNEELAGVELTAAREELRIARLRFELGRSLFLEVLDAIATLSRARNNKSQATHARGLAEAEFLYAIGRY
jgi:outer membrane protein TolC